MAKAERGDGRLPTPDSRLPIPVISRVIYLHGFASSAQSSKAQFFAGKFAELGIPLVAPDLNAPDFGTLTVTRMLDEVGTVLAQGEPGPVVLMGSSLGGFVAWHAAAGWRRCCRSIRSPGSCCSRRP